MDNLFVEAQKKVRRAKRKEELEELSTAEEDKGTRKAYKKERSGTNKDC